MVEFEESQQQCYPFLKLFVSYEDRRSELTKRVLAFCFHLGGPL